jgi:hypothetical protein
VLRDDFSEKIIRVIRGFAVVCYEMEPTLVESVPCLLVAKWIEGSAVERGSQGLNISYLCD